MIPRLQAAFRLAASQLLRNWSRSLLTSLGVLVGVAAVIAVVGIGAGASASITRDLASMGNNLLLLEAGRGGGPQARVAAPGFRLGDVELLRGQVPYLSAAAPTAAAAITAVAGGEQWDTTVTGTSADWFIATNTGIARGRAFLESEERAGANVCVIGGTVAEALFGDADPLGASLRAGGADCEVIGVLEAKGANTMGMDQDDRVVAPIRFVFRRLLGTDEIQSVWLSVDDPAHMDAAAAALDLAARDLRHVASDEAVDFEIRDTREFASRMSGITTVLTGVLSAVAAVSLLVGGIGVMNVMLVSVTERTHEIGVRLSVGALEGDVMAQFLTEAALLAGLGGAAGIVLGAAATGLGSVALGIPFVIDPGSVVLALLGSAGIGVLFGWVPAKRAAQLEPIDALRA